MTVVVLGIDLGKNSCSLAGLDESGAVVLRPRLRREAVSDLSDGLLGKCRHMWKPRTPLAYSKVIAK